MVATLATPSLAIELAVDVQVVALSIPIGRVTARARHTAAARR
jgi:hypothetical protein